MRLVTAVGGVLGVLGVVGGTGCGAPDGGSGDGTCAYVVVHDGRAYWGTGDDRGFEVGEVVGAATQPRCDDAPGRGDGGTDVQTLTAYRVQGVAVGTAIAVGVAPDDLVLARVDPDRLGTDVVRELFEES
ncbi:DUF6281 family protein [Streptomyces broussonetiae]|uniref:DUF6281 family protein n=1 Tax=Streptomyces broussonetiae TaxID=2686304 RepID=A0ABV5EME5_9ACTN